MSTPSIHTKQLLILNKIISEKWSLEHYNETIIITSLNGDRCRFHSDLLNPNICKSRIGFNLSFTPEAPTFYLCGMTLLTWDMNTTLGCIIGFMENPKSHYMTWQLKDNDIEDQTSVSQVAG